MYLHAPANNATMPPKTPSGQKTFAEKAVVVLVAQIVANKQSLPLKLMSGYDAAHGGSTSVSGFEHQFRAIVKEARQLNDTLAQNPNAYPEVPSSARKTNGKVKPRHLRIYAYRCIGGGGAGTKRAAAAEDGEDSDSEAAQTATPSKKKKAAAKPIVKHEVSQQEQDDMDAFFDFDKK